jgi:hypothetical protein
MLVAAALEGLLVGEDLELVVREADQEEEACCTAVIKDTALATGTRRLTIARLSMDLGSTLTSGLILQMLAPGWDYERGRRGRFGSNNDRGWNGGYR